MTSEQVQSKLDVLKQNLQRLAEIPQTSYESFVADFRNVASTLYLLQTSSQALIDLGAFVASERGLPVPRTSHEVFEHLEEAGVLPAGHAERSAPIVGFRNRVVHLYDRIDERRVYEILVNHHNDLAELLDLLLAAIEE